MRPLKTETHMPRLAIFAAFVVLASAAGASETRPRLTGPWPEPRQSEALVGDTVAFPSRSPFSPADLAPGGAAPATEARATLFLPPGRPKPRSVPAVIMLHGSGGVLWAREITYGRQFAAMGIAALVVDAFASRREMASGFIDRLLNITETMMLADAFAGLDYLARRPEIDADRVALIGFSYGGMATMYAMNARLSEQLGAGRRFAAHVAFYGPCIARFADTRTTGAPLLMLYGTADILIDRGRCEEVADDMRRGGSAVDIIAYEGAPHQWDGGWGRRLIGRNLAPCRIEVERDGTARDQRTLLPMSGPTLRRIILGLCVANEPYLIGSDEAVRARSNLDMGRFLARALNVDRR
jgi:dienelactone hydrolase